MVEIILAQFDNKLDINPSYISFKKYFPEAKFVLYTDSKEINIEGIEVRQVIPPKIFKENKKRYGNRCNDFYKVLGLVESEEDIVIAVDNDMKIVSNEVLYLLELTMKFGLCLPMNPRWLVKIDTLIGEDTDKILDETNGLGFACNMTPISFKTKNSMFRRVLDKYLDIMRFNPVRGPLAMWRAFLDLGYFPCLLPPQWCVCQEHCGIGNEIILHVGHKKVQKFYNKENY